MHKRITMPDWWHTESANLPKAIPTLEERMREVIRFSRLNIEHGTGGPFAAGVFERDTGKPVLIGVNRVVPLGMSSAHAEVIALTLAQEKLATYDLGGSEQPVHQFVVNWRPCAMCYGATLWSGVRELVIPGSDSALEDITGFDEGPVVADWEGELTRRGINVINNVLREEAVTVFKQFRDSGSLVYNGRLGD